ncbi:helix-turn-helix domain-containing protein [Rudanella paleaurantiibacter]|uniref:Helix-turn-helix domain-containing protein n=1 Tax=Rudanella paleaurantiibacter TaxID=2614655 RepID=A0A7J5U174_9BACT|nr:helix-turn-helix domain-containing protein [Rudanella paleaurantiibacter]KAB7731429.1 helix-turn-helix domain-containing protein [Rudanella paleaurantiibacter]
MYGTVTQIQVTPDQLTELVLGAVRSELANYTPPAPAHPDLPEYLTRKETAKLLRIALVTLHEWTKAGTLQSFNMNGRIRYRRDDVVNLIAQVDTLKYKQK